MNHPRTDIKVKPAIRYAEFEDGRIDPIYKKSYDLMRPNSEHFLQFIQCCISLNM